MRDGRGGGWVAGQLALFAAIALAPRQMAGLPPWPAWLRGPAAALGVVLVVAGTLVGGTAARQLGGSLTIFPRPRPGAALVRHGLYGALRHPIYTGLVLCAVGFSLLRAGTPPLLLSAVLWAFLERKAQREERWLAAEFPEYGEYRRSVPNAILPLPRPARDRRTRA